MTHNDKVAQMTEGLDEDTFEGLERVVVSMVGDEASAEPAPGPRKSFEEAMAYSLSTFEKTLHRLAQ